MSRKGRKKSHAYEGPSMVSRREKVTEGGGGRERDRVGTVALGATLPPKASLARPQTTRGWDLSAARTLALFGFVGAALR